VPAVTLIPRCLADRTPVDASGELPWWVGPGCEPVVEPLVVAMCLVLGFLPLASAAAATLPQSRACSAAEPMPTDLGAIFRRRRQAALGRASPLLLVGAGRIAQLAAMVWLAAALIPATPAAGPTGGGWGPLAILAVAGVLVHVLAALAGAVATAKRLSRHTSRLGRRHRLRRPDPRRSWWTIREASSSDASEDGAREPGDMQAPAPGDSGGVGLAGGAADAGPAGSRHAVQGGGRREAGPPGTRAELVVGDDGSDPLEMFSRLGAVSRAAVLLCALGDAETASSAAAQLLLAGASTRRLRQLKAVPRLTLQVLSGAEAGEAFPAAASASARAAWLDFGAVWVSRSESHKTECGSATSLGSDVSTGPSGSACALSSASMVPQACPGHGGAGGSGRLATVAETSETPSPAGRERGLGQQDSLSVGAGSHRLSARAGGGVSASRAHLPSAERATDAASGARIAAHPAGTAVAARWDSSGGFGGGGFGGGGGARQSVASNASEAVSRQQVQVLVAGAEHDEPTGSVRGGVLATAHWKSPEGPPALWPGSRHNGSESRPAELLRSPGADGEPRGSGTHEARTGESGLPTVLTLGGLHAPPRDGRVGPGPEASRLVGARLAGEGPASHGGGAPEAAPRGFAGGAAGLRCWLPLARLAAAAARAAPEAISVCVALVTVACAASAGSGWSAGMEPLVERLAAEAVGGEPGPTVVAALRGPVAAWAWAQLSVLVCCGAFAAVVGVVLVACGALLSRRAVREKPGL